MFPPFAKPAKDGAPHSLPVHVNLKARATRHAYDEFWMELGAERATDKFFRSPIPLREKPIDLIKKGHRARTRKKRAMKQQIADAVFRSLFGNTESILVPSDSVCASVEMPLPEAERTLFHKSA